MQIQHPGSDGDDWVYVAGSRYAVDDGIVDCPERAAETLADNYGTTLAQLAVDKSDTEEICGTEKADGDICERPADECPYHS